jgi:hypothetical protein
MINFTLLHPQMKFEYLGLLPEFFSEADPRPAREQIHEAYAHGGGWSPRGSWSYSPLNDVIEYLGDRPLQPIAKATLHGEKIFLYESAWVAIVQPDGSFEVSRCD